VKLPPIATGTLLLAAVLCRAQSLENERTFTQSVSVVEAALKKLYGGTSGPLPLLDGFVVAGLRELDRYQRPYYQVTVRVTAAASGGARVRVSAKITAWRSDAHPGYALLESSGRLESDFLERLQDFLTAKSPSRGMTSDGAISAVAPTHATGDTPLISAPTQPFPKHFGSQLPSNDSKARVADSELELEAKNLEEILRNQSHPTNLIAVKQNQTPVLQRPSLDGKVLFLASAEDEFEVLVANPDWVHVRISGLSRGWLRRSMVDFIDGSGATRTASSSKNENVGAGHSQATALFSISSEEVGSFPGAWPPLNGKTVRIISVQQTTGTGQTSSSEDKLRFAQSVFQSEAESLPESANGLVLIFDSQDGGMVAAPRALIEKWKKGSVSEQAFWQQCLRDPALILGATN
jgi:hypothetical protein